MSAPEQASRPTVHRAAAVPERRAGEEPRPSGAPMRRIRASGPRPRITGRHRPGRVGRSAPVDPGRTGAVRPRRPVPSRHGQRAWPATRVTVRSTRPTSPPRWAAITTVRPSSHGASGVAQRASRAGVEVGGGLVEQDHGHVAQHGAADGDALALAGARGSGPPSPTGVASPSGQPGHQPVEPGPLEGPAHFGVGGSGVARGGGCPRGCRARGAGRWGTQATCRRHSRSSSRSGDASPIGRPRPTRARRSPAARSAASTCPSPTRPTTATCSPGCRARSTPSSTGRVRPGWRTVTSASRTGAGPGRGADGRRRTVVRTARTASAASSTSRMRAAAARPSALAWNSAPARRSGR